jgi:hypothetical protein
LTSPDWAIEPHNALIPVALYSSFEARRARNRPTPVFRGWRVASQLRCPV